ncbi:MAG: hypothetical protein M1827_003296 [Pycnora praestabilis]|nr:MAG: hypothetical protein M1827_003296 [Pycnora praestabilis]
MSPEQLGTVDASTPASGGSNDPKTEDESLKVKDSLATELTENKSNAGGRDDTPNSSKLAGEEGSGERPEELYPGLQTLDGVFGESSNGSSAPRYSVVANSENLEDQTQKLSLSSNNTESSRALRDEQSFPIPPPPPPKDEAYIGSAAKAASSPQPHAAPLTVDIFSEEPRARPKGDSHDKAPTSGPQASLDYESEVRSSRSEDAGDDGDSKSEIQSIMEQFEEGSRGPGVEEVMSPRLEFAAPISGGPAQHPPRKSSLEALSPRGSRQSHDVTSLQELPSFPPAFSSNADRRISSPVPPRSSSIHSFSPYPQLDSRPSGSENSGSPGLSASLHKPPPPEPDPEPDLPFDFHRFLEQLRHRTADPVAKFLRSFLLEFGKKQWMVHEQVKIISDFLLFITNKMAQCEVWRGVSDAEFDNAREGMEKLVMNRLYTQTFSPAIAPPQSIPEARGKKRNAERELTTGRRGQHQEDVERDEVLAQKVRIYGWVREEHLDIEPVGEGGRKFLVLAQQELLKIRTYRAPRDKVICVLNCCKVIFGLLKHAKSDQSADSFVPLLIYVVLQANPEHMVSNVQYILRFRNQDKLGGEAGYYLSSLMGAVQFIENLDRTTLTVSDADFEKHVEAAVSAIAEKHQEEESQVPNHVHISEKSSLSRPEVTPRHSMEAERATPRRSLSSRDRPEASTGGDSTDEKAVVAGLLRTIQRPLSSLGRIFSEDNTAHQQQVSSANHPALTPQPGNSPRLSPAPQLPRKSNEERRRQAGEPALEANGTSNQERSRASAEDAAARQASAEAAEAQRLQRSEYNDVVETLSGMFPDLDKEVIGDVVRLKEGRVGLAVDACLALST